MEGRMRRFIALAVVAVSAIHAHADTVLLSGSGSVTISRSNGEIVSDSVVATSYPHIGGDAVARVEAGPPRSTTPFMQRADAGAPGLSHGPGDPEFSSRVVAATRIYEAA